jgi:hypothetical protein
MVLAMEPIADNRRHGRHRVAYKVIFSSDGRQIEDGLVVDVSHAGCRISSARPLPLGTSFELQIRPEKHAFVYVPSAVVRWVQATTFGVEFIALPEIEAATLTRLICLLPN